MAQNRFNCITWSDDLRRIYNDVARGKPATAEEVRFMAESLSWMEAQTKKNKPPK